MGVTWKEKRQARQIDLFDYLMKYQRDRVVVDGNSLRLVDNRSVSIKKGFSAFKDFADGRTGNAIDLLVDYMGFDFCEAVKALNTEPTTVKKDPICPQKKPYCLPTQAADTRRIKSYLSAERGIDKSFIDWLIGKGVLYQDDYSNCVFVSPQKDFYELRGIFNRPYHGSDDLSPESTNYWYFNNPSARALTKAFICESAIDAISLYLLNPDDGYYFSIAGVGNQQRIDAIKQLGLVTYTAFDNDEAGQGGRNRNNDLKHLIPDDGCKDWNEQLRKNRAERNKPKWK